MSFSSVSNETVKTTENTTIAELTTRTTFVNFNVTINDTGNYFGIVALVNGKEEVVDYEYTWFVNGKYWETNLHPVFFGVSASEPYTLKCVVVHRATRVTRIVNKKIDPNNIY